jgi:hypothetical protein
LRRIGIATDEAIAEMSDESAAEKQEGNCEVDRKRAEVLEEPIVAPMRPRLRADRAVMLSRADDFVPPSGPRFERIGA